MSTEKSKRIGLVFISLFVTLLIVEGTLRLFSWGFYYLQERQNKAPVISEEVQTNKNREKYNNQTEKNDIVILCIGESTTGLGGSNSWPSQLQRILNSIQDEKTFHVINKGLPGEDTSFILRYLPDYLSRYKPDLVLAMVGINDGRFPRIATSQTMDRTSKGYLADLLREYRTYGLIEWIIGGIKARIIGNSGDLAATREVADAGKEKPVPVYHLINSGVTHLHPTTIRNLNNMVNLTTERGIKFVFVQYALRKIDILRKVILRDVFYVSNYEIFSDMLDQYRYDELFSDDFAGDFGHATVFGNRIIANNVAQELLKVLEGNN